MRYEGDQEEPEYRIPCEQLDKEGLVPIYVCPQPPRTMADIGHVIVSFEDAKFEPLRFSAAQAFRFADILSRAARDSE